MPKGPGGPGCRSCAHSRDPFGPSCEGPSSGAAMAALAAQNKSAAVPGISHCFAYDLFMDPKLPVMEAKA
jgi:hypothetical protein